MASVKHFANGFVKIKFLSTDVVLSCFYNFGWVTCPVLVLPMERSFHSMEMQC